MHYDRARRRRGAGPGECRTGIKHASSPVAGARRHSRVRRAKVIVDPGAVMPAGSVAVTPAGREAACCRRSSRRRRRILRQPEAHVSSTGPGRGSGYRACDASSRWLAVRR
ncbi:hypothetical protein ACPA9J_27115 [Pseudomonas aeruginosa]